MACGNNHVSRAYLASAPAASASNVDTFLSAAPKGRSYRQELGARGEALVAKFLVEAQQHALVFQHTPGERSQGVDIVTLAPDGRVIVTEVKATGADQYRAPHTTQNVKDHQLDATWTSRNLTKTGVVPAGPDAVGASADQVDRQLAQVDYVSRTVSFWEIDDGGKRIGESPTEVWNLSDFEGED